MSGGAAVGGARHDRAVELFERPALLDKRGGEPVEQLGVRRFFSGAAKIIRVARERLAEMPEPDAIHDRTRGERVVRTRDPLGEGAAAALDRIGHGSFLDRAEDTQHAGRHFSAIRKRIAVGEDAGFLEFAVGHAVGGHSQRGED